LPFCTDFLSCGSSNRVGGSLINHKTLRNWCCRAGLAFAANVPEFSWSLEKPCRSSSVADASIRRSEAAQINRNPTAKWRVASALIAIRSFAEIAGAATSERRWSRRDGVVAIAVVLYVIFCLLAGLAGSQRRMGFFGTFLLSLVITPLLVLLLLILTRPSRGERNRSPQSN
jgi:hypothetical protein